MAGPGDRWLEFADDLFAATYVNLFVTRRQVITARFGDPFGDGAAERTSPPSFPAGGSACSISTGSCAAAEASAA